MPNIGKKLQDLAKGDADKNKVHYQRQASASAQRDAEAAYRLLNKEFGE